MGSPKPCLGYPSRTAAIKGLRSQGLTTQMIAEAIGINANTVTALECSGARQRLIEEPLPSAMAGRGVTVPTDIINSLAPHAARRGCHPHTLARAILSVVVKDNMVDAILDDADEILEAMQ